MEVLRSSNTESCISAVQMSQNPYEKVLSLGPGPCTLIHDWIDIRIPAYHLGPLQGKSNLRADFDLGFGQSEPRERPVNLGGPGVLGPGAKALRRQPRGSEEEF